MGSKLKEIIGESAGKEAKLKIANWLSENAKYETYYPHGHEDIVGNALQNERNYILNCSDFPKDLSPEASNRRILNDIDRMAKARRV